MRERSGEVGMIADERCVVCWQVSGAVGVDRAEGRGLRRLGDVLPAALMLLALGLSVVLVALRPAATEGPPLLVLATPHQPQQLHPGLDLLQGKCTTLSL